MFAYKAAYYLGQAGLVGKLQTVGTYDLTGAAADKAVILRFSATDTATVKLVIDTPAKKDGKSFFSLAEITVG